MTNHNQLKNHLKNFTVKELKKEVIDVKKGFQVSKLKRAEVENVILKNPQHFLHLLKKNRVKKTKPTPVKKTKPIVKDITNKQQYNTSKYNKSQYDMLMKQLNKKTNDTQVKEYISQLLDQLDEKAAGSRNPEFIYDRHSGLIIQKAKSNYIIRNNIGNVLLSTPNRKQVEDFLFQILK